MGITFDVDHIIPESIGGPTELNNLCLTCPTCNRHKSDRMLVLDPDTGRRVPFFHPLQEVWHEHFEWLDNGASLFGKTPIARATIEALQINRPVIVQLRRYWIALDLHPKG